MLFCIFTDVNISIRQEIFFFFNSVNLNSKPCVILLYSGMKYSICQNLGVSNTPAAVFQSQTL